MLNLHKRMVVIFQSTLPVWGATLLHLGIVQTNTYFNPRSPCGERRILVHM